MNTYIKKAIINTGLLLGTAFFGLNAIAIAKKGDSQYDKEPEKKNPMEGKIVVFIEDPNDKEKSFLSVWSKICSSIYWESLHRGKRDY